MKNYIFKEKVLKTKENEKEVAAASEMRLKKMWN